MLDALLVLVYLQAALITKRTTRASAETFPDYLASFSELLTTATPPRQAPRGGDCNAVWR